ncbi:Collectin-12 [Holothuria leucospilota]|uniref:Collectin-12 n=1 Tax=Holothuria leucospilota TaxID=206669 RepID=A0A9Q1BSG8_HOLLE|nr:Collectin-12 [Holothuria leucospilota]
MTWEKAMNKCSSLEEGAHLVFIESEQENRAVSRLALGVSCLKKAEWWIGLNDKDAEDSWKWNDTPVNYTNWNNGEPNGNKTENCGEFKRWKDDNAWWNDRRCSKTNQFICEMDAPAKL